MPQTLTILAPFQLRRCTLSGCEHQAAFRMGPHYICQFHHMLLLHGRGLVNYMTIEAQAEAGLTPGGGDESFGLSVEDEDELETPGGKPQ